MKIKSYNKEISIATLMFSDLFNDILIDRVDKLGNVQKTIPVPCVYGGRSRILKSLENRGKNLPLPMIAVTMTNISREDSRIHSVNDFLTKNSGGHFDVRNMTAVPINISYDVSIMTKYQADMNQIIGNFIPFFNKDVYVTWDHPYDDARIKSQVIWDGDIEMVIPEEIAETDPWRIEGRASFIFKTWFFPGTPSDEDGQYPFGSPLIYNINLCGGSLTLSGSIQPFPSVSGDLNNWYDVPTSMDIDTFIDHIEQGLIKSPNFDRLPISGGFLDPDNPCSYWQTVSGLLSGTVYNPNNDSDLLVLLDNVNNPDLTIITDAGYLTQAMQGVDWSDIWSRQLSGDLQDCVL